MPELRIIVPQELDRALDSLVKAGFAGNKAELGRVALTHLLSSLPMQVQRGYDLENAFSPDGRVFQLEYARETVKRGGTIVGLRCSEGVILAKRVRTKEIREKYPFVTIPNCFLKIYRVRDHIAMVHCGLLIDGFFVAHEALKQAESLEKEGGVDIETLAERLFLFMQSFGQRKDVRPLGTAFIIGGIDSQNKPRLFHVEGTGRAWEYDAQVEGMGKEQSIGVLKKEYRTNLSLDQATMLAIKAASRETTKPEDVLVATISAKTKEFRELTHEEKKGILEKIIGED